MKSQKKIDALYMDWALRVAEESHCVRKKVGCVLSKNNSVIAYGYNGTPSGDENCCEDENGVTKSNVIHAEDNCFRKLLLSHETSIGATMYITLSPCMRCSDLLIGSGIKRVVYLNSYHCDLGIERLIKNGIIVDYVLGV